MSKNTKRSTQVAVRLYTLGNRMYAEGDYEQAIFFFAAALDAGPKLKKIKYARRKLGSALLQQDKIQDAIQVLRDAVKQNPKDGLAHLHLAEACRTAEDFEAAQRHINYALMYRPTDSAVHLVQAQIYLNTASAGMAQTHYEIALKFDPECLEALLGLADLLYSIRQYPLLLDILDDQPRKLKNNAEVMERRIQCLNAMHMIDERNRSMARLAGISMHSRSFQNTNLIYEHPLMTQRAINEGKRGNKAM